MKTDDFSKNVIAMMIAFVSMCLVLFVTCKSANNNVLAQSEPSPCGTVSVPEREIVWYNDVLRAYNHVLHRIWLDKPSYVEDVLCECDEFVKLDSLMNGHWEDTFEFYSVEDSFTYRMNYNEYDGYVRVMRHVVNPDTIPEIPAHTKQKLNQVFNK